MLELGGDVGARHIIGGNGELVAEIPADPREIFMDVDTPEAYRQLLAGYGIVSTALYHEALVAKARTGFGKGRLAGCHRHRAARQPPALRRPGDDRSALRRRQDCGCRA